MGIWTRWGLWGLRMPNRQSQRSTMLVLPGIGGTLLAHPNVTGQFWLLSTFLPQLLKRSIEKIWVFREILAIGLVADHIHLLVGLKATHSLADVLRELKKASSAWV